MNRDYIETFLAIVHSGTISGASRSLFLSQSSVSDRIRQLESKVGTPLIERKRGSRRISLTEKGKQFVLLAERYMALEKEMDYFLLDEDEMHLAISAAPSVLTFMFADVICDMVQNEKTLRIKLASPNAHTTYQQIESMEADIGFLFFPQNFENVNTKPYLSEDMVLLLSSQNDWPERPLHPKELNPENEVRARWSPEIEIWHNIQWPMCNRPSIWLEYANVLGNMLACEPYLWSLCPISVAMKLKSSCPDLQIRDCSVSIPKRTCYVLTRRNLNKNSADAIEILNSYLDPFIRSKNYYTLL